MNCWMCGNLADSGEHKIKKSLLKRAYDDLSTEEHLVHIKDSGTSKLQSLNSKKIKYKKTICSTCNNTKSQPYDRAFQQFHDYVYDNVESIIKTRVIDLFEVYGTTYLQDTINLYKYFVKIFGCDLKEVNHEVPQDLVELLNRQMFTTKLRITFSIDDERITDEFPEGLGVGIGELIVNQVSKTDKTPMGYQFSIYFSCMKIYFWYNYKIDKPYGAAWVADSRFIYLGLAGI